jgi:signal transduction histidine kinase
VAFVVLLVVCVAQLGWWLIDQWMYASETNARIHAAYSESLRVARSLSDRGFPTESIAEMFPEIIATPQGLTIDAALLAAADDERWSRVNQYAWEGGFFLVVLLATIGVLRSAIRSEARLRRRQQNFVTAVTHELKSPLAAMRLAAETLEFRDTDAEAKERLTRRLLASLDRMESTVSNVLDTARIDEGKLSLAPDDVDAVGLVRDIIESMANTAHSRGVTLELNAPERLDVRADAHALTAVVRNLIDNALGAVAGVEKGAVAVSIQEGPQGAIIEVGDNGRGFDPSAAEKLFEKFYRPGDEMRREGRGTGLGLYIARYLAASSDAKLTARSQGPGTGATFRLVWPRAGR